MRYDVIAILILLGIILAGCNVGAATVCDKYDDEFERNDCIVNLGETNLDSRVCDEIEGRARHHCIESVAEVADDIVQCENIKGDSYWSDICYRHFAEKNADSEVCETISSEKSRNECLYNVAVDRQDFWECENLYGEDDVKYNQCVFQVSVLNEDIETCVYLPNFIDRSMCVEKIAKSKNDVEFCKEVKAPIIRISCYKHFGIESEEQDPTMTFEEYVNNVDNLLTQRVKETAAKEAEESKAK